MRASALLEASRVTLRSLALDSDWLTVSADGSGRLVEELPVTADVAWRFIANPDLELTGTLAVDGDRDAYQIEHRLTAPYQVATNGSIALSGESPTVDLTHRWVQLEHVIETGEIERRLTFHDGALATRGNPEALSLDLTTALSLDDRTATLTSTGIGHATGLELVHARLDGDVGQLEVDGRIDWEDAVAATLTASLANFDTSLLHPAAPGSVGARATLDVAAQGETMSLAIVLHELDGLFRALPLSGSGRLRAEKTASALATTLEQLDIGLGASRLSAAGTVAERFDLRSSVSIGDLAEFDERLTGALDVTTALTGAVSAPSFDVQAQAVNVSYQDGIAGAATVGLTGTASAHQLGLDWSSADGSLTAQLTGGVTDERWTGRLDALSAASDLLAGTWSLDAATPLSASAAAASVDRLCLSNAASGGQACLDGEYGDDTVMGNLRIASLPLTALPLGLPADASLGGHLNADAEASFVSGTLNVTANATFDEATLSTMQGAEPLTLAFTDASVGLDVVDNALASQLRVDINGGAGVLQLDLNADDVLNTASNLSGSGTIDVPDASIFAALLPELSEPSGSLTGQLDVAGSLAAPALTGEIALVDAAFGVRASGIDVRDVELRLSQDEPGRLRLRGVAASGEGRVALDGFTELGTETGLRTELSLQGNDFQLARLPDWYIAASPDITLLLDDRRANVSGELSIPAADITIRSIPESAVQPSGDVTVHGEAIGTAEPTRRIGVDVTTTLGESVRLSGYGLKTRVVGDLRVQGSSGSPFTGSGTLSLQDGRYKAYGQDLEIETGELVFNGPLEDPQLAIRALRRIDADNVVAGIDVSGTPRRLRSNVFSEPPLGDAEALSYLLTGRPLSRSNDDDTDLLNQAAFALGLSQAGSIASELRSGLGLDTLAVESAGGTGRIVAGKRFGDRLLVEYGYGLVDKLGTLLLRYELNSRLVLESRSGTASELDLVYSVRKR